MICSFQCAKHNTYCANGGDKESRTPDPLLARQVLSQLSYAPTSMRDELSRLDSKPIAPQKGGDPAAPSDTATLLRLHPSH